MPKSKKQKRQGRGGDGITVRNGVFYIAYKDAQGRRRREATAAQTLTQARDIRAKKREDAEKQRVFGYTEPSKTTFAEFVKRYLKHQEAKLTPQAYERSRGICEKHLIGAFGSMRLADIRRADVDKYLTNRSEHVEDGSIIKEFNVLKHLLKLAVAWELIPTNHAQGVRPPKQPAGRIRYLRDPAELRRLLTAAPTWLRPIVALAVATGMRQGELLGLRPMDIDTDGCVAALPETKNGEPRSVPLSREAMIVVGSLKIEDLPAAEPLFDIAQRNRVSVAFARAARKAKIPDFTFHDLRHTFASWMVMAGASLRYIADVLGHKSLKMVMRYAHLSPQFKEKEVGRIDGLLAGVLTSGPQLAAEAATS